MVKTVTCFAFRDMYDNKYCDVYRYLGHVLGSLQTLRSLVYINISVTRRGEFMEYTSNVII